MRRGIIVAVAVAVLIAAAASAWYFLANRDTPERAATAYLRAWEGNDYRRMGSLLADPSSDLPRVYEEAFKELRIARRSFRLRETGSESDGTVAPFDAAFELEGFGNFGYRGQLQLVEREGRWLVSWSPSAIHPKMPSGGRFDLTKTWPARGKILAADGQAFAQTQRTVLIGIQRSRIRDRNEVIQALVANLGSDPARINSLLGRQGRQDEFIPVEEVSAERYEQLKPAIYPVPGLVFQNKQGRLPPAAGFAEHVTGRIGLATKEMLERLGDPYGSGDVAGISGLEAALEKTLAGRPSADVSIVDAEGRRVETVHRFEGKDGESVETTLSMDVQRAAEAALDGISHPAAIVVVDAETSDIRAVVSRPIGQFNRALSGRYPPGSSFKIVTTAALLGNGVTERRPTECPSQIEVGGKTFRNFEGETLGTIPFRDAFAHSCNTAFIRLVSSLSDGDLSSAANGFGFGAKYSLPLNAYSGSFPDPRDATERAASAIGQGRVLASPLHMATVAGAVKAAAWRPPRLLASETPSENRDLDPAHASTIQALMGSVVAEGTGVRARVPGKEVAGKTGTAEFGPQRPPQTHAWFVGFSGPYAFAVVVEGGGVGGQVAAPIAAKLVSGL
ncbi:MAG: penicillin-binding transpeptidase domain-containing protein [Actinomycetota bacterium]|nr:penicillin-binding transpeptidase domain-containing protein [Actinomycetota bacterium]